MKLTDSREINKQVLTKNCGKFEFTDLEGGYYTVTVLGVPDTIMYLNLNDDRTDLVMAVTGKGTVRLTDVESASNTADLVLTRAADGAVWKAVAPGMPADWTVPLNRSLVGWTIQGDNSGKVYMVGERLEDRHGMVLEAVWKEIAAPEQLDLTDIGDDTVDVTEGSEAAQLIAAVAAANKGVYTASEKVRTVPIVQQADTGGMMQTLDAASLITALSANKRKVTGEDGNVVLDMDGQPKTEPAPLGTTIMKEGVGGVELPAADVRAIADEVKSAQKGGSLTVTIAQEDADEAKNALKDKLDGCFTVSAAMNLTVAVNGDTTRANALARKAKIILEGISSAAQPHSVFFVSKATGTVTNYTDHVQNFGAEAERNAKGDDDETFRVVVNDAILEEGIWIVADTKASEANYTLKLRRGHAAEWSTGYGFEVVITPLGDVPDGDISRMTVLTTTVMLPNKAVGVAADSSLTLSCGGFRKVANNEDGTFEYVYSFGVDDLSRYPQKVIVNVYDKQFTISQRANAGKCIARCVDEGDAETNASLWELLR